MLPYEERVYRLLRHTDYLNIAPDVMDAIWAFIGYEEIISAIRRTVANTNDPNADQHIEVKRTIKITIV
jgi:hypothetical protein